MNRGVSLLLAAFGSLIVATIYIAHRDFDGLVDRKYYESGSNAFSELEEEARLGFAAVLDGRFRTGNNRVRAVLSTSAGPLRGARVRLDTMRPGGTSEDRSFEMTEETPGVYAADVPLPVPGSWIVALAADAGKLHPRRRWTIEAAPGETPGTFRGAAGGKEVVLAISPWPPPAMREIDFTLTLPGYSGTSPPTIDLSMAGMDMGRNRVDLSPGAGGRYRGTGVFVRCPSGRHDWEATVNVPGAGKAVFRIAVAD